ncbi:Serine/threonine-protein kinase PknB [Phycisphaerae bacterium RAS1]|nr:Serine/threonine-protein kinase PknB [Phycisphaerae bacterium RAS1]
MQVPHNAPQGSSQQAADALAGLARPAASPPETPPPQPATEPASGSRISTSDQPTRVTGSRSNVPAELIPAVGAHIEGYELQEEIHRGGQGVVYRAVQLGTKRQVALKVLLEGPFASETARRRFEREVELAASLRHANIVTILDSGISHGRYFFAMEYVDGVRMDRHLAQTRPDLRQTLTLLATVCEAVNFAHQRGVIHRDLKPSNILVDADGQPRVLDFGLAKPVHETSSNDETIQLLSITGQILGTVAYMSPEQAGGTTDVDVRSDVYALGVVFYESLLGQPPYAVSGPLAEVLSRIAHDDPTPPRSLRGRAPLAALVGDELETILLRALEKTPPRRYQTAGDLARDLRHLLAGEPIEAKRASGLYMLRKTLKRYKIQAFFAGTILVMLIVFLVVFAVQYNKASFEKKQAEKARNEAREQAVQAAAAAESERAARREADQSAGRAQAATEELRRAVVRQKIQRGDLARARGDLTLARDSFWEAVEDSGGGGPALWALRQYYVETGDSGARLAALQKHNLSVVSPDGRLLAIVEGDTSISVVDAVSGRLVQWFRSPGRPSAISVADDGGVTAGGAGWARAWRAGLLRPVAASALPGGVESAPLAVMAVGDTPWLAVVDAAACRLYRASGELADELTLRAPVGTPDFDPESGAIALPSGAGVELITVEPSGKLNSEPFGRFGNQRNEPPRQACFSDDELTVLADTIYAAKLSGPDKGEWNPLLYTAERWDWFDRRAGSSTIILGRRDGRVALYHGDTLQETWRVTTTVLERGWLPRDATDVRTLDERGAVTSWVGANRTAQSRTLYSRNPIALWETSADGSAALFADDRGRVLAYRPGASDRPAALLPPRVLSGLAGRATDGLILSLSGDGNVALVADGGTLRLIDTLRAGGSRPREFRLQNVGMSALSDDGSLAAVLVSPRSGERQVVQILSTSAGDKSPRPRLRRDELTPAGPGYAFLGSAVRQLAFVPGSQRLLVARSNGDLTELLPEPGSKPAAEAADGVSPPPPRATLDSPPSQVRIDRQGRRAAFMCDDRVLRWISLETWAIEGMLELDVPATSLAFDSTGDVLLIRTADGAAGLLDLATREMAARWTLPAGAEPPVAGWIGGDNALLMTDGDKLVEIRYDKADELIARNRAYARQRAVMRWLSAGDYPQAWLAAFGVLQCDAVLGRDVKEAVLETVLRRRSASVPDSWAPPILDGQPAASYARLGHAAYEGERFADALGLFRTAAELSDQALDAATLLRLAQCEYLAGNYATAAAGLAGVAESADFDRYELPTIQLQRAAALLLARDAAEARRVVNRFGAADESGPRLNIAGAASARVIGRYIVGLESESVLAEGLVRLVSLADESLLYRDDIHFFLGEMARSRGQWKEAQGQYQRCIDLARDAWPSNWARYRIAQGAAAMSAGREKP